MIVGIAAVVAAVVIGPAGNAQKLDLRAELRSLVEAEQAFARTVATRGVREGFLAYLAPDAVLFRPGPVNGRQWLTDRPAPRTALTWTPTFADVARSGDLGYTTGPWESRLRERRGTTTGFGQYVTLWRKQPDGKWKVLVDVGTETPRPPAPARPFVPAPSATAGLVLRPAADPDSERVTLLGLESAFSDAADSLGMARAYDAYAARELRLLRPARVPWSGLTAARRFLQTQTGALAWVPEAAEVSRAGDLAYAYGSYRYSARGAPAAAAETGYFFHLWKRHSNGAWQLVLDVANPAPPAAKS